MIPIQLDRIMVWASYPILTFPDVPEVVIELINQPCAVLGRGPSVSGLCCLRLRCLRRHDRIEQDGVGSDMVSSRIRVSRRGERIGNVPQSRLRRSLHLETQIARHIGVADRRVAAAQDQAEAIEGDAIIPNRAHRVSLTQKSLVYFQRRHRSWGRKVSHQKASRLQALPVLVGVLRRTDRQRDRDDTQLIVGRVLADNLPSLLLGHRPTMAELIF